VRGGKVMGGGADVSGGGWKGGRVWGVERGEGGGRVVRRVEGGGIVVTKGMVRGEKEEGGRVGVGEGAGWE